MRVVCVGLATVDLVQRVTRLPGADEKVESLSVETAAGGPATNAAVTAAALGADAILVTAVGVHPLGALIRADLAACSVTLLDAAIGDAAPPVSAVTVLAGSGRRSVVSRNAGDLAVAVPPGLAALVAGADVVLVDGHHPALAEAAAAAARAAGRPVVVDAGSWRPVMARLLPLADVVACSATFRPPEPDDSGRTMGPGPGDSGRAMGPGPGDSGRTMGPGPGDSGRARGPGEPAPATGEAESRDGRTARAVRAAGVPHVAVTHGPDPVTWWSGSRAGTLAVPPVAAVDTAGAGDVFHGALAVAVGRDPRVTDLPAALRQAITVAGIRVGHAGPRSWLSDPQLRR
jgi:sugar/nucleoside kinase (ribokinase family)